jgi:class 3 adenylate cyclase/pimeloyl-ACP methyl ester carboxylesterase
MTDAPRIQYVKTSDGVNIAYAVAGSGPPVVWSHNIFQSHLQLAWEQPPLRGGFENVIAAGATLVRFDPRGSGLSDRDVKDVSSSAHARDLEAVVDKLQIERFSILAIEWGSAAAIVYATLHRERVSRIVLVNPASFASQTARGRSWMGLADDWEMMTETVAGMAFGFGYKESSKYAAFMRAAVDHETFLRYMAEPVDLTGLAKDIQVPTLVVRHSGIPWLSMESTRELVAALPDCTMVAIEGNYIDQGRETGRAIVEFLAPELQHESSTTQEPKRSQAAPPGPSAFRTVLFTDLVGHTEMMSRLGDERGRDVLREHERITREVLKANGGTEVKTMGDGFMASFGSVTKAVECAVALQRAFAERGSVGAPLGDGGGVGGAAPNNAAMQNRSVGQGAASSAPTEPLSVRCGLNAGEPIEEDGDLFGATVILASRIAAKADGGEILVADTVRGLCSGKGFLFSDRGEFVAKGFEEPVRVYEVSWRE